DESAAEPVVNGGGQGCDAGRLDLEGSHRRGDQLGAARARKSFRSQRLWHRDPTTREERLSGGLRPRPQVAQYIRFGLLNQSITGGYLAPPQPSPNRRLSSARIAGAISLRSSA